MVGLARWGALTSSTVEGVQGAELKAPTTRTQSASLIMSREKS